ncbi:ATP-dependent DNA helicase RRM3 [Frankliniella fusca]|uniref:ATP-dependent DNA helicase n=1 Tax=Frankliniella fusca TaxID=407009 RepID=A0AAE1LG20_9NEOP|nr:ATP-dependent DNA helicase RRM3 [Frankliniella fusca]
MLSSISKKRKANGAAGGDSKVRKTDGVSDVGNGTGTVAATESVQVCSSGDTDDVDLRHKKLSWRRCCFKACLLSRCSKGTLHSFPKGEENLTRCKEWIKNSGNSELLAASRDCLSRKFVCGSHFANDSYVNRKIGRLKRDAVPTENLCDVFVDTQIANYQLSQESCTSTQEIVESNILGVSDVGNGTGTVAATESVQVCGSADTKDVDLRHKKLSWRRCCFKACLLSSCSKGTLHSFPKGEENLTRCKEWIKNSGNSELLAASRDCLSRKFVCGSHFANDSYVNRKIGRLKRDAVPTENLCDVFVDTQIANCQLSQESCTSNEGIVENNIPGNVANLHDMQNISDGSRNQCSSEGMCCDDGVESSYASLNVISESRVTLVPMAKSSWRKCCFNGCAGDCTNRTLHTFPRIFCNGHLNVNNLKRCGEWIQASGNESLLTVPSSDLYNRYFVCSFHFSKDKYFNGRSKKIRIDAVPTENIVGMLSSNVMTKFPVWDCNVINSDIVDENVGTGGVLNRSVTPNYDGYQQKFEDHMKSGVWSTCEQCKERFLHRGKRKKKCIHKSDVCKSLSCENGMDPGTVPDVLSGLTYVEEQLIARIHPVVSLFKIKGHQFGYSGNVINFPQKVENFAKVLPHKVTDLASVVTVRTNSSITSKDFHVRGAKVLEALKWLKCNNKYYHDIEISLENISILPVDGNVFDEIRSMQSSSLNEDDDSQDADGEIENNVVETNVPCVAVPTQNDSIRSVLDWPELGCVPINEFKSDGYIAQAFPCLYPTGEGDLRSPRDIIIKPSTYFKHMIRYHDERFAKHPRYRFFALNSMMRWTALSDGNMFVEQNPEYGSMTVKELKDKLKVDSKVLSKIMFHGRNIRGTKAFWRARSKELVEMVEQLKLPTLFFTLSAADLHWPELFAILSPDEDQITMTEGRRRQLIQENPVIVDTFFLDRVESFIDLVLRPKFNVKDFWFRIEYQHRGSPHVHGVLWLSDAPDVLKLNSMSSEELEEIVKYYDNLICTIHPDVNCPPAVLHPCRTFLSEAVNMRTDLAELLNKVQRHSCSSSYCIRKNKKTGVTECRFKFPFEMETVSQLKLNESGSYELLTARNDELLNKYNKYIIQSWRANMDISPCLSKEALLSYLTKYVTKSEVKSRHLEETMKVVFDRTSDDKAAKEAVQKLFIQTCCERDYSAQEVCHLIMGLKLVSSGGRDFVSVRTSNDEKWTRLSKKSGQVQQSFVDKYRCRSDELHAMCLWEAAQKVYLPSGKRRTKNAIVLVYPKLRRRSNDLNKEEWYRQQVLLYVPWKHDEKMFEAEGSWEELYDKYKNEIVKFCGDFDVGPVECDAEYEEIVNESDRTLCAVEDYMSVSAMAPGSILQSVDLGDREIDVMYDWNANCIVKDRSVTSVRSLQQFIYMSKKSAESCSESVSVMPNVTFNEEQTEVLRIVEKQIQFLKDGGGTAVKNFPKQVIVQGKAGTGKSLVIHAMQGLINSALGDGTVLLVAPTGVAAVGIGGATIHSKLHISQSNEFHPMRGSSARKFINEMEKVKFLVVDEYSMIGLNLLGMMERRCREGKGSEDMFGGLFVYLFGDIKQLNPVLDTALYDVPRPYMEVALHGKVAFESFDGAVVLSAVMRQKDNKFKQLLDNVGSGKVTIEDYRWPHTQRGLAWLVWPGLAGRAGRVRTPAQRSAMRVRRK